VHFLCPLPTFPEEFSSSPLYSQDEHKQTA
jgi:hypothetical protein